MWELWRAHDVFESGTVLDAKGIPVPGSRALPDGEILAGTPTPAIVPLPTLAMAPMPTAARPGYPFFVPAVAGHRPPPSLDTIDDGGLPRHIITGGTAVSVETRLDFSKVVVTAIAQSSRKQERLRKSQRWSITNNGSIPALHQMAQPPASS